MSTRTTTSTPYAYQALELDRHVLHKPLPNVEQVWLPMGSHMPTNLNSAPDTSEHHNNGLQASMDICQGGGMSPWHTRIDCIRSRLKFWCEVHRVVGTKPMISTAFHPQMDGVTERANCSIGQILRIMVQPDQTDWREKLSMVEFH